MPDAITPPHAAPSHPAAPRICVLLNSGSGKQTSGENHIAIEAAFAALGVPATVRILNRSTSVEDQARTALAGGYDTIVAAGGDGTICAVASVVVAHETARLGVIALGTFNYFGRSLSLPSDIPAAIKVIADGLVSGVDVGFVNDHIFLNNSSLGAYPAILQKREDIYRSWGRSRVMAYYSVLLSLWQRRGHLEAQITAGGQTQRVKAAMIMCVNNAYQLREMDLPQADHVSKGALALYITPQMRPVQLIGSAWRLLRQKPERKRDYEVITGTDFTVRPRRLWQRIARDGEWHREKGPFRFRLVPGALRVIVPKTETAEPLQ